MEYRRPLGQDTTKILSVEAGEVFSTESKKLVMEKKPSAEEVPQTMNDFIYVPVEIKEGCEMPSYGEVVNVFEKNCTVAKFSVYTEGGFKEFGSYINPTHWLKKVPVSEYMSDAGLIKEQLLLIMQENLKAIQYCKKMGWRDTLKSSNAFDCVIETYEDLINIITYLPLKVDEEKMKQVADYLNASKPSISPIQEDWREKFCKTFDEAYTDYELSQLTKYIEENIINKKSACGGKNL